MDTNIKFMVVIQKLQMSFLKKLGQNINDLGMTNSEFLILAHLNEKDKEKTQKLGEIAAITSGTITYTVKKLLKQGYVTKLPDENDHRISWVILTETGRARYQTLFQQHKSYLDQLLNQFSEQEKLAFIEQVKYFGKNIESH